MRWTCPSIFLLAAIGCGSGAAGPVADAGGGDVLTASDVRTDADRAAVDAVAAEDVRADADRPAVDAFTADVGSPDATAPDRFSALRARLARAVSEGTVPGLQFVLRDAREAPLLEFAAGAYALDQQLPLDSSIKPVTSLVLHTLVRDGMLRYEDTLGERLGWTGREAAVTVEQLLAFSSGFPGNSTCLTLPPMLTAQGALRVPMDRASLADCATTVRTNGLAGTPGTEFRYGANHQLLLALVAETVTGRPWAELFDQRVRAPLGLGDAQIRYTNNRVAASAVGNARAFAAIYRAMGIDAGLLGARPQVPTFLPPSIADRFFADYIRARSVRIVDSPWQALNREVHFGLGVWILCDDYADPNTCVYLGSGGNGTTAWIDPQSRYAAALVLYQGSFAGYRDGYALMLELLPLLRAALSGT